MNNTEPPRTAMDYIVLRQLAAITNKAMDCLEDHRPVQLASLDRIAHNVETVSCLRGDSGIHEATRPEELAAYQEEMYAIENQLRTRLISLGYEYPAPRPLSETA